MDRDERIAAVLADTRAARDSSLVGSGNRFNTHLGVTTAAIAAFMVAVTSEELSKAEASLVCFTVSIVFVSLALPTYARLIEFTESQKRKQRLIDRLTDELLRESEFVTALAAARGGARTGSRPRVTQALRSISTLGGTVVVTVVLGAAAAAGSLAWRWTNGAVPIAAFSTAGALVGAGLAWGVKQSQV